MLESWHVSVHHHGRGVLSFRMVEPRGISWPCKIAPWPAAIAARNSSSPSANRNSTRKRASSTSRRVAPPAGKRASAIVQAALSASCSTRSARSAAPLRKCRSHLAPTNRCTVRTATRRSSAGASERNNFAQFSLGFPSFARNAAAWAKWSGVRDEEQIIRNRFNVYI